jgi:metacaspase-1
VPMINRVFLSYSDANRDQVESLARRLYADGRLTFWFAPWHSVPGQPLQEQMEAALGQAQACAVFVGGADATIAGWQNEQMRTAIQTRVEDEQSYRVIPVLLPGPARPSRRDLPPFLRRYELVEFADLEETAAFKRLLAGILGIPPIQVDDHIQAEATSVRAPQPASGHFAYGHALVIGIAGYQAVSSLPAVVRNDASTLRHLLVDPARCGYPPGQVSLLLDKQATRDNLRQTLDDLAQRTTPDDTVVLFFSGHGARDSDGAAYLLPHDCRLDSLQDTALASAEVTAWLNSIRAARLLVLLDCCHSGGIGDPKGGSGGLKQGWSNDAYAQLAQGRGRALIASSRPDEPSWVLPGMENSLFTHHLLEALRGEGRTLGDGYVRVFDLFRHVAEQAPRRAAQHPIFKAADMEIDFPVALVRS